MPVPIVSPICIKSVWLIGSVAQCHHTLHSAAICSCSRLHILYHSRLIRGCCSFLIIIILMFTDKSQTLYLFSTVLSLFERKLEIGSTITLHKFHLIIDQFVCGKGTIESLLMCKLSSILVTIWLSLGSSCGWCSLQHWARWHCHWTAAGESGKQILIFWWKMCRVELGWGGRDSYQQLYYNEII